MGFGCFNVNKDYEYRVFEGSECCVRAIIYDLKYEKLLRLTRNRRKSSRGMNLIFPLLFKLSRSRAEIFPYE